MSKTKTDELTYSQLKESVFETAKELYARGPGWAQERAVLQEVFKRNGGQYQHSRRYDELQQRILTCWHDLFRSGDLSWGFNLDNPNSPFFHVPVRETERELASVRVGKS